MRVLHVIPSLAARLGGTVTYVLETCTALEREGVVTAIFATDQGHAPARRLTHRATLDDLPPAAAGLDVRLFRGRVPHRFAYSSELAAALSTAVSDFDLVHIHNLFLHTQFAAARAARPRQVPYVVSLHGALDPYLRRRGRLRKTVNDMLWQRRMLERAQAIHVLTATELEQTADIAPRVPRILVPAGISVADFAAPPPPELFRATHLGGMALPYVLYSGRLSHKKGLDLLIDSFARVSGFEVKLVIAGPDDEGLTPSLRARAEGHGIGASVVFTGPIYRAMLQSALAGCQAWVLPSHTENFGIAVIEALAAGAPVICSRGVAVAESMEAAGAGLLTEMHPDALSRGILRLLGEPQLREQLAKRGPEHARQYDWSIVAPAMAQAYRDVIAGEGDRLVTAALVAPY